MQHTKTYKLNLIETSDAFSPLPLNENAEKTEAALGRMDGAVARCREENCLVKLGGPLTAQSREQELIFDLSGVDMGQFIALLFLGRSIGHAAVLKINELEHRIAIQTYSACNTGFALLMDADEGRLNVDSIYVAESGPTGIAPGRSYVRHSCTIAEIEKLTIFGEYHAGTRFTLYGIRA